MAGKGGHTYRHKPTRHKLASLIQKSSSSPFQQNNEPDSADTYIHSTSFIVVLRSSSSSTKLNQLFISYSSLKVNAITDYYDSHSNTSIQLCCLCDSMSCVCTDYLRKVDDDIPRNPWIWLFDLQFYYHKFSFIIKLRCGLNLVRLHSLQSNI